MRFVHFSSSLLASLLLLLHPICMCNAKTETQASDGAAAATAIPAAVYVPIFRYIRVCSSRRPSVRSLSQFAFAILLHYSIPSLCIYVHLVHTDLSIINCTFRGDIEGDVRGRFSTTRTSSEPARHRQALLPQPEHSDSWPATSF